MALVVCSVHLLLWAEHCRVVEVAHRVSALCLQGHGRTLHSAGIHTGSTVRLAIPGQINANKQTQKALVVTRGFVLCVNRAGSSPRLSIVSAALVRQGISNRPAAQQPRRSARDFARPTYRCTAHRYCPPAKYTAAPAAAGLCPAAYLARTAVAHLPAADQCSVDRSGRHGRGVAKRAR